MKIKSIYIDGLHTVHDKTYTFNDITYLYGRNGVGKSTVLNAIQLALLGYIPGTSKTKSAIIRHSNNGSIVVKIVLDDNGNEVVIDRIMTDNLNTVNVTPEGYDISEILKDVELPIFNFNEFVGQTANKLKDYFIKNILPINDGSIMWTEILTDAVKDMNIENRAEILGRAISLVSNLSGDPINQAIQANQLFKDEQSACSAELKSLQGAIDSLIFYDDYTGSTDVDELDNQIRELSLLKDRVIAYKTAEMQTKSIQDSLNSAFTELEALKSKGNLDSFKELTNQMSEACKAASDKVSDIEHKINDIDYQIRSTDTFTTSKGICPYTKEACPTITDKVNDLCDKVRELSKQKEDYLQELRDARNVLAEKTDLFRKADADVNKWNTLTSQIANLNNAIGSMPTKPDTDKNSMEIAEEIKVLQDNKMKAFANKKYNDTVDDLTAKKFKLELELDVYKALAKLTDVNNLQTKLMEQPFNQLADKMTNYIQTMYGRDDIKAHFYVSSKANSFSFGMIRNGKYIPYDLLSSGEKCLYTLALMICIIDNSKSPLKVVLLDDALDNLDDVAIENTFTALKNLTGIQFILAGVKHCDNASDVIVEVS